MKYLDISKQDKPILKKIIKDFQKIISKNDFILGSFVKIFEKEFASFCGSKYAIGCANGTDALTIALKSLNLPKNSEVIIPAMTYCSTAFAVINANLTPVLVDIDYLKPTISTEKIKKKINSKTRVIIPVHLYGSSADLKNIIKLIKNKNIKIIEDCAQAHGAYDDSNKFKKKIGSTGDISCFSFYPGKNLGAYGDAGAIVTNNEYLFNKCKMIANHGRMAKYDHKFEGRNSRMDGIQGAILNVKLKYLDQWILTRKDAAQKYNELLSKISDISLPIEKDWASHVYHLYVLRYNMRDELKTNLSNQGISCGIHYPIALPKLEAYKYLNQYNEKGFAWISDNSLLSLPISDTINLNEVIEVSEALINSI